MKRTILALVVLTIFACNKSTNNNSNTSTCICDGQTEYVCWKLNGTNKSITNLAKQVDDVFAQGLRHYAFQDLNSPKFYLEFEWPSQITIGRTYNLDLNTSSGQYDFDYGYGSDTVFYKGTFLMEENNTTYIKGKFTASDAKVNGIPNPNIIITNGCFKLLK
jgi:hypothetical protein